MIWLKKIIAILAVSFVATSSNLNADILDEIPADIRDFVYDPNFMDPNQPLGESAYRNWKSERPKPWTIGYASSYAGNLWRKGVMERLYGDYLPKMKEAGYLEDIVVTQSNLKDAVQIQQMRQLTDQGVDALIVCCSNPVALNPTIDYAYSQGVPTASMTGYLTSEYAISTSVNYALTDIILHNGLRSLLVEREMW
jgi:ribose transport system substrate-binding protein